MKTPFHGALTLLIFLLTIICTYALAPQSLRIRIPRTGWSVPLSSCWIPWLATVLLLIFQAITFADVGNALAGDGTLKPSSVIVTYNSLAYMAISCEITGLFAWLALHVARWARGRALLLVATSFCLTGVLTATTGPDASLIALTPTMVYVAGACNLDPMSMAATHMGAASVWGMLVQVAGPVNIIISHAFQLSFLRFLCWMVLPTNAAALVIFVLLYVLLHRRRQASVRYDTGTGALPCPDPGVMLHDQVGAACTSALLCGCLLALAVAPWLRWTSWLVTVVFAIVAALYNMAASWGPLRAAIGRRSAYERRRRLQAELAQQGLHRVVSDEDLADLLLSAAQDRQASFTRLAAATASRVTAAARQPPPPQASAPAPTPLDNSWQQQQQNQQPVLQQQLSWTYRPSGSGWSLAGFGSRASSSGFLAASGSLSHGLPSGASMGGGASSGVSPVRHWFSRRWSSYRGWSLPPHASMELVDAAADAGADLGILGECGVLPTGGRSSAAAPGSAHSAAAAAAPAGATAAAAADRTARGAADGRLLADGRCGALAMSGTASSGPVLPRLSGELHQLLTHGTSVAPDTLEWWAAAAMGAQELLRGRAEEPTGVSAAPRTAHRAQEQAGDPPDGSRMDVRGGLGDRGSGGDAGSDNLRSGCQQYCKGPQYRATAAWSAAARSAGSGSLTRASAFAAPDAMTSPGWDGRLTSASAYWAAADAGAGVDARQSPPLRNSGGGGGGSSTSGGGFWHPGSHRRQRSYDSVNVASKLRAWAAQPFHARVDDPRDTCGAADSGSGGGAVGHSSGRFKGFGVGGRSSSLGRCRGISDDGGGGAGQATGTAGDTAGVSCSPSAAAALATAAPSCLDPTRHPDQRLASLTLRHADRPGQQMVTRYPDALSSQAMTHGSLGPPCSLHLHPLRPLHPQQPLLHQQQSHSHSQVTPDAEPATPGNFRSSHCSEDEEDRGSEHSDLAAALLHPAELSDVAGRSGRRGSVEEPSAGEVSLGADPLPPAPPQMQRRQSRLSLPGFEGLFGRWRRGGVDPESTETESTALLPDRVATSDDPRHLVQVPLPPVPPPSAALAAGEKPTDSFLRNPSSLACPAVHMYNDKGHGQAAAAAALNGRDSPGPSVATSSGNFRGRSPFSIVSGDVWGRGAANGNGVGGGSSAAEQPGRCDSLAASGSTASWGHYKLRRPSVALLLVGSSEVSFLGTFLALPWANTILLLGWFVLVEALQVHGWLDSLADSLTAIASSEDPLQRAASPQVAGANATANALARNASTGTSAAGVAGAVFALGWLSALLSLGMTGQCAALLLARVMMRPEFLAAAAAAAAAAPTGSGSSGVADLGLAASRAAPWAAATGHGGGGVHVSPAHRGAQLALVVAANMAPALSLSGSLTALRWGLGLKALGVRLRCCRYMVSGLVPAAGAGVAAALLVLWGQCVAWGLG